MGTARLAVYLVGLVVVVAAVWVFFTMTPIGQAVPSGVALALILLLVGIGIMASARSINEQRSVHRVVHDAPGVAPARVYDTRYSTGYDPLAPPVGGTRESVVEERRYD